MTSPDTVPADTGKLGELMVRVHGPVMRRCASPKDGHRQLWEEWQVRRGRRVLSRHDLREQAERAIAKVSAKGYET